MHLNAIYVAREECYLLPCFNSPATLPCSRASPRGCEGTMPCRRVSAEALARRDDEPDNMTFLVSASLPRVTQRHCSFSIARLSLSQPLSSPYSHLHEYDAGSGPSANALTKFPEPLVSMGASIPPRPLLACPSSTTKVTGRSLVTRAGDNDGPCCDLSGCSNPPWIGSARLIRRSQPHRLNGLPASLHPEA